MKIVLCGMLAGSGLVLLVLGMGFNMSLLIIIGAVLAALAGISGLIFAASSDIQVMKYYRIKRRFLLVNFLKRYSHFYPQIVEEKAFRKWYRGDKI